MLVLQPPNQSPTLLALLRIAQQLAQHKTYIRSFPGVAILQIARKRGPTTLNHHTIQPL